jgi:hypothetical protein
MCVVIERFIFGSALLSNSEFLKYVKCDVSSVKHGFIFDW